MAKYYGGMTPEECAKRISYPWFVATLLQMEREWEQPSRTDHYIMANTAEVRRGWLPPEMRNSVKAEEFRLKLADGESDGRDYEVTDEEWQRRVEDSKSTALGLIAAASPTGHVKVKTMTREEAEPWNPPVWTERGYE